MSKTVFVGSLGPETKAPAIKRHFERVVGKVVDCSVVPGKYYGFVTFETAQLAEKALGKHDVDGRLLTVKKDTRPRDPKGLSGLPRSREASVDYTPPPPPPPPRPKVDIGPPPENAWGGPPRQQQQPRTLGRSELVDDAALRGFADLIARDAGVPANNNGLPSNPLNGGTLPGWGAAPGFGGAREEARPSLVDALGGVELAPAPASAGFFGNGLGGLNALAAAPAPPPPGIAPTLWIRARSRRRCRTRSSARTARRSAR